MTTTVRDQLEALADLDRDSREQGFLALVRRFGEGGPEVEGMSPRDEAQTIAVELEHLGYTREQFFEAVDRRAWLRQRAELAAKVDGRARADRAARDALRETQARVKAEHERLVAEERAAFHATIATSDRHREAEQAMQELLRTDDPLGRPLATAYVEALRQREALSARVEAARVDAERQRAPIDDEERLAAWIERERVKLVRHYTENAPPPAGVAVEDSPNLRRALFDMDEIARLASGELDNALEDAKRAESARLSALLRVWI